MQIGGHPPHERTGPEPLPIARLKGAHAGEALQVVGSGPSLALLTEEMLPPGPVVAINHAIRIVEQLGLPNIVYSMQKDQAYYLCASTILAHRQESAKDNDFGDYAFDCEADFSIPWETPSIVVCLYLARLFGCVKVTFHCCDSFHRDYRSYDGQVISSDFRAAHYAYHPRMVTDHAGKIGMPWNAT